MTRVIKICQTSLPGRWLAIISVATNEGPPVVDSRGSEAATSLSGAAWNTCFSLPCAEESCDGSGPEC